VHENRTRAKKGRRPRRRTGLGGRIREEALSGENPKEEAGLRSSLIMISMEKNENREVKPKNYGEDDTSYGEKTYL
jgi:hypothetical protein